MEQVNVTTTREIQEAVRAQTMLLPISGGTKSALSRSNNGAKVNRASVNSTNVNSANAIQLDLSRLSGILEYQPGEYTFTALAGTPVTEVEAALAKNGQYLPFEPPLDQHGATLGGTVAAGLSGSARYRYGGVRDFLIGLRFVDGNGQLISGGGKVVKNAAGFDLPKLMVGSLGRLSILTELSFKVFPQPQTFITLLLTYDSLAAGVDAVRRLTLSPYDIEALDLAPTAEGARLEVRLGGLETVLPERAERLLSHLGANVAQSQTPGQIRLAGADDAEHWLRVRNFGWAGVEQSNSAKSGSTKPDSIKSDESVKLVKVPTTPSKIAQLDAELAAHAVPRRYCVGGNLTWIAWSGDVAVLDQLLSEQVLSGLVILGDVVEPMIGVQTGQYFAQQLKAALDPENRFLGLYS